MIQPNFKVDRIPQRRIRPLRAIGEEFKNYVQRLRPEFGQFVEHLVNGERLVAHRAAIVRFLTYAVKARTASGKPLCLYWFTT